MAISYISNMQDKIEKITLDKLLQLNFTTQTAFLLPLNEQDEAVYCEKIVRLLPRKRLVIFGAWKSQSVVVKIFFARKAQRHYERELQGIQTLLASGVPTPRILFNGTTYKKRAYVLMCEKITDAHSLHDLWQNKTSSEELIPILRAVTIELATQHVLGIMQQDLHFKNFLLKGQQIFTLDGGNIENFKELLPKKLSLDHLALFFSQLGVGSGRLQQILFKTYVEARGWLIKPADINFLSTAIQKWNARRRRSYEKKITRTCSAFVKVKKSTSLVMYDRDYFSAALQAFLQDPEKIFSAPTTEIIKAGRTATVFKINLAGKDLIVKRYNIKSIWHWARRSMRTTRAAKSWRLANMLRLFGVPTPRPVAFMEKRLLGLRHVSYILMEYIEGPHLGEYFSTYRADDFHFEKIGSRVIDLLKNLLQLRISHGDLKHTNILLHNEQPFLLDLDGMKEYVTQKNAQRAYKKEVKRFMENWKNQPAVKNLFARLL